MLKITGNENVKGIKIIQHSKDYMKMKIVAIQDSIFIGKSYLMDSSLKY